MLLKEHTTHGVKDILSLPVIRHLLQANSSTVQFKEFIIQKALIREGLIQMLMRCMDLAKHRDVDDVAKVMCSNLDDELGVDGEGNIDNGKSHAHWLGLFLRAMNIKQSDFDNTEELLETKDYIATLNEIVESDNLFYIAGAILMLERIIPIEFRAIKTSRDQILPDVFLEQNGDNESTKATKADSRRYIDDHITHDASIHFPEMLQVLERYTHIPSAFAQMEKGMNTIIGARQNFYSGIKAMWAI